MQNEICKTVKILSVAPPHTFFFAEYDVMKACVDRGSCTRLGSG